MLDRLKHETTMRNILDDIYNDNFLSNKLGFKGGTCAYFFYELPRFSTDLDFNLISTRDSIDESKGTIEDESSKSTLANQVFEKLEELLKKHGEVRDRHIKANTIFFYVVHTPNKSGIKIEISTREIEKINAYELKEFYGTSFLIMKRADLFANKLLALTMRVNPSARDLYDINFFFSKNWDINENVVSEASGKAFLEYVEALPKFIEETFNSANVHLGLGELLKGQSERDFVKRKLVEDTVNKIRFFVDAHKRF